MDSLYSKDDVQQVYNQAVIESDGDPVEALGKTVKAMEESMDMGGMDEWHEQLLDLFEMIGYIDPNYYNKYQQMLDLGDSYFFGDTKRYEDLERPDPFTLSVMDSDYKEYIDRFLNFYADRWMDFEEAATDEIEEYWQKQDELLLDDLGHPATESIEMEESGSGYINAYKEQIDQLYDVLTANEHEKKIHLLWEETYSFIDKPEKRETMIIYQDWMKDNPYFANVLGRRLFEMTLEGNFITIIVEEKTDGRPELYGYFAGDMLTPLTEAKLKKEIERLGLDLGSIDEYDCKMVSADD